MIAEPQFRRATPSVKSTATQIRPQPRQRSQPSRKAYPFWLRVLLGLQSSCFLLALGGLGLTLVTYALTFYTQQQWNQQYNQLQELQQQERHLNILNESLKEEMVSDSTMIDGTLVPLTPDKTIYLEPAPIEDSKNHSPEEKTPQQSPERDYPLAY